MTSERGRHLVVMQDGRIIGIVPIADLIKARIKDAKTESKVLCELALGQIAARRTRAPRNLDDTRSRSAYCAGHLPADLGDTFSHQALKVVGNGALAIDVAVGLGGGQLRSRRLAAR